MSDLTISQINTILKSSIENITTLKNFWFEGEVAEITYRGPHLYLTMKDNESSIKICYFNYSSSFNEVLEKGEKIRAYGSVNFYKVTAQTQIVIKQIEKQNSIGKLYQQLEELKKYYQDKGFFLPSIKKPIPKNIKNIGVVTSVDGDAVRDIIKNTRIRDDRVNIYVYDAKVQGDLAELTIAKGIKYFNEEFDIKVDCIIIGRGGGSALDLWAFNKKEVVEAVYESDIFVVSAVGHEADVLLSDYVADLRAATPTQAAQLIVKDKQDYFKQINEYKEKSSRILQRKLMIAKKEIEFISQRDSIKNFYSNTILERRNYLTNISQQLNKSLYNKVGYASKKNILNNYSDKLNLIIKSRISKLKLELYNKKHNVDKYSISDILDRGFSISTIDDKLIKDIKIEKGMLMTTLIKGNIKIISEVKND